MLSLRLPILFFHWRVKLCCYWYVLPSIALPDRHYPCCLSTCQFIQGIVPQNPLLIDEESAAINLQPETFTEGFLVFDDSLLAPILSGCFISS
jgi:hypothetical protein